MPRIDVVCKSCEAVSEVIRPLAMWPATPECPSCGQATEQIHLPKKIQWTVDPVVVFKAPDGSYRFPGDANGQSVAHYAKQGYQRVEIRGALEMRSFESKMNKIEYARAERKIERSQRAREEREHEMRANLFHQMKTMSNIGKDVARAAMARNDGKPLPKADGGGFHSEVYSFSRSNRDESRDSGGRRRQD